MPIRRAGTRYRKLHDETNIGEEADDIELLQSASPHLNEAQRLSSSPTRTESHDTILKAPQTLTTATQLSSKNGDSPTTARTQRPSTQRLLSGWRVGVLASLLGTFSVFVFNFGITLWVYKRPKFDASSRSDTGVMYRGKCAEARRFNVLVHLLVNILGTLLLDASSYCMQVLSAPNREELIQAHAHRYWLHIAVPSLRNLSRIGKDRVALWVLLLFSSVPLHLLFNSVVFLDLQANNYAVIPATEDWLRNRAYDTSAFIDFNQSATNLAIDRIDKFRSAIMDELKDSSNGMTAKYENVSKTEDCFNKYNGQYLSDIGNVYLIQEKPPTLRDPYKWFPAFNNTGQFLWLPSNKWPKPKEEIWNPIRFEANFSFPFISTPDFYPSNGWRCPSRAAKACDVENEFQITKGKTKWEPYESPIKYCLIEKTEEQCHVRFSFPIAIAVVATNFVKTVCMALTLFVYRKHAAIVTIGDAVASFLEHPDKETRGRCLYDRRLMEAQWNWEYAHGAGKDELGVEPERFVLKAHSWSRAPSGYRWIATYLLCSFASIFGLATMARSLSGMPKHPAKLWKIGFGEVRGNNLLNYSTSFIGSVFLANTPQAVLSYLSLLFEALYTNMFVASEWASYIKERKPLRVTSPSGQQRSTYWLNVPFRYAVPKTIIFGIFHWLTSQSIFTVQITATDLHTRKLDTKPSVSTCGYSPMAIILTFWVGVLIAISGIAIGKFRYAAGMPLASSCSAAISAACHPPPDDVDAGLSPVQWGAVTHGSESADVEESIGHCTFSSLPVDPPIPGHMYA